VIRVERIAAEFSRHPKLEMQKISPSTIVDCTLQLLSHRLKSYNVKPELNAYEAMGKHEKD